MNRIKRMAAVDAAWYHMDGPANLAMVTGVSSPAPPVTTLFGDLPDQAALAGVLNTLYDLHLAVLSVERLSAEWQYSKGVAQ